MKWTCTICSEFCGSANFQNSTVRTHYSCTHHLHWLHVGERIFQTGSYDVLIHPRHLSILPTVLFHSVTSRRQLRFSASHHPEVPPVCLSTVGKRVFPVSGATVWNDLPLHFASVPSLVVFRHKTFLFSCSYHIDSC